MAVPFAQTTRSLNADRGIASLVLLALLTLLLAGWLIWAFTVRFAVYAVSETSGIRLDNTITTTFTADAAKPLKVGQKALVYLDAPPLSEPVIIPAQVINIEGAADGTRVEVAPDLRQFEADAVNPEILAAFSQPVSGHVEVEAETLSPALLVLRSAGLTANTAPLISRP